MPALLPPSIVPIAAGYRLAAHFVYMGTGEESRTVNIMGSSFNGALEYDIDLKAIQTPANLRTIKAIQFSLVVTSSATTVLQLGTFYIVVDRLQVFAFEVVRNPPGVEGFSHTSITAAIPIQSNAKTEMQFVLVLPNYVVGQEAASLYINCFDFDVAPFVAESHTVYTS